MLGLILMGLIGSYATYSIVENLLDDDNGHDGSDDEAGTPDETPSDGGSGEPDDSTDDTDPDDTPDLTEEDGLDLIGLSGIGADLEGAGAVSISLSQSTVDALAALDDGDAPVLLLSETDGETDLDSLSITLEDGAAGDGYLHMVQGDYMSDDTQYGVEMLIRSDSEDAPDGITFDENGTPVLADGQELILSAVNYIANGDTGLELYAGAQISDPDDELSTVYGYDADLYFPDDVSGTDLSLVTDGDALRLDLSEENMAASSGITYDTGVVFDPDNSTAYAGGLYTFTGSIAHYQDVTESFDPNAANEMIISVPDGYEVYEVINDNDYGDTGGDIYTINTYYVIVPAGTELTEASLTEIESDFESTSLVPSGTEVGVQAIAPTVDYAQIIAIQTQQSTASDDQFTSPGAIESTLDLTVNFEGVSGVSGTIDLSDGDPDWLTEARANVTV
ncbi:hypothetical protein [Celeribacter baekdonensis]|uniref:Uncharacterized protein n=1 Tax=Celeribacter baekdonensis TaxID=875171 RepID=A0A2R4M4A3_9RHOB|nr:hypothetical protein [Celeribacter baekdonensis]AVW91927.1 hypothetical protein DA792_13270 [Celeribacter baekdonensis]|tara:strand:+ start:101768 stop:103114 length:1347 start_codon:yes stop_codon:yes gene_type:complete